MATSIETENQTVADLLERLGDVPPARIRIQPPPGTATEADVLEIRSRRKRLCELVDGVLVEKAMGFSESAIAGLILAFLRGFVIPRNLGIVVGADGMMRLQPGLVRIPDVAYLSWARFPDGRYPGAPIPDVAPDLAVEVVSESNTRAEMERKRREYFDAGVCVVWEIAPKTRTVTVSTGPEESTILGKNDILEGGSLLPGFLVPVLDIFAELDRQRGQENPAGAANLQEHGNK